jgi:hypothetical protein
MSCYFDDRFPDGHRVAPDEDPGDLADAPEIWHTDVDADGRLVITVNDWAAEGAPDCWYVSMISTGPDRPTATVVAYPSAHFAPGTVITDREFFGAPVHNDEQIAALRWYRSEAVVEQVYVTPALRRRHMATKIIYAASAYHQAGGWNGRLHSDGRRTDLGEQLVVGLRHGVRIAPLEHRMAPMDPDAT